MAAKQKPMTKEELRAPDEVEVALSSFWEKLYNYRKFIIGGVVALLVVGVALWFSGRASESSKAATGDALAEALKPVGASTGEEPAWYATLENVPKPIHYADEATREAAAKASLAKFVAEHGSAGSVELVELTEAQLKLRSGDAAGALSAVDAWIGKYGSSTALPLAHDLKARALLASDKRAEAIAAWQAASGTVGGEFKAHFLTQIGDLQNPAMYPGAGDKAKAVAAYKEALALLPPAPASSVPGMPTFGPRSELEARIAIIE